MDSIDLSGLPQLITGVFAVTTLVAGAMLGLQRGVNGTLRSNANDLQQRVGIQDDELKRKDDEIADRDAQLAQRDTALERKDAELTHVKAELETLGKALSGETYFVALSEMLTGHHRDATQQWGQAAEHWKATRAQTAANTEILRQILAALTRKDPSDDPEAT